MAHRRKVPATKDSFYLPVELIQAMRIVSEYEGILKSYQVEIALRDYLTRHEQLLRSHGIEIWPKGGPSGLSAHEDYDEEKK